VFGKADPFRLGAIYGRQYMQKRTRRLHSNVRMEQVIRRKRMETRAQLPVLFVRGHGLGQDQVRGEIDTANNQQQGANKAQNTKTIA
jgi:hypothetical protein